MPAASLDHRVQVRVVRVRCSALHLTANRRSPFVSLHADEICVCLSSLMSWRRRRSRHSLTADVTFRLCRSLEGQSLNFWTATDVRVSFPRWSVFAHSVNSDRRDLQYIVNAAL